MPEVEVLMQEWPSDFEELLKEVKEVCVCVCLYL